MSNKQSKTLLADALNATLDIMSTTKSTPRIGITHGIRGHFAVMYDEEGPIQSGICSFDNAEKAKADAINWAKSEFDDDWQKHCDYKEVVDGRELIIENIPVDADERMCIQLFDNNGVLSQRTYGQTPTEAQKAHDNHTCGCFCGICYDEACKSLEESRSLKLVSTDDHLMTIEEFKAGVATTAFVDDDGFGYYAYATVYTDKRVVPSDITKGLIDDTYTHVVWFNK